MNRGLIRIRPVQRCGRNSPLGAVLLYPRQLDLLSRLGVAALGRNWLLNVHGGWAIIRV